MSRNPLEDIIGRLGGDDDDDKEPVPCTDMETVMALSKKTTLKIGDRVVWKPGLKNAKFPDYDEPIIVSRVYDEPLHDGATDTGDWDFHAPVDFAAPFVINGRYYEYHFDSRRFTLYEGETVN